MATIRTRCHDSSRSVGKEESGSMASKIANIFAASRFVLPEQREALVEK